MVFDTSAREEEERRACVSLAKPGKEWRRTQLGKIDSQERQRPLEDATNLELHQVVLHFQSSAVGDDRGLLVFPFEVFLRLGERGTGTLFSSPQTAERKTREDEQADHRGKSDSRNDVRKDDNEKEKCRAHDDADEREISSLLSLGEVVILPSPMSTPRPSRQRAVDRFTVQ